MRRHLQSWFPVILWMGFIFAMSSRLGSGENTNWLISAVLHWLEPGISDANVARVTFLCRKTGHFTEYAVLALLLARALPGNWTVRRNAGLAVVLAAFYAATDEWHQSFVPGRTASVLDVLLDTSGAATAILIKWLIRWRTRPDVK